MYTILYLVLAKLRHSSRSAVVWDSEKLTFASGLHIALSHAEGGHTTLLAAGHRTIYSDFNHLANVHDHTQSSGVRDWSALAA